MAINNATRALFALGKIYGIVESPENLQPDWHLEVIAHCPLEEVAFMETVLDQHLGKEPKDDMDATRAAICAFAARRAEFHL